jgi:hypothetical protein
MRFSKYSGRFPQFMGLPVSRTASVSAGQGIIVRAPSYVTAQPAFPLPCSVSTSAIRANQKFSQKSVKRGEVAERVVRLGVFRFVSFLSVAYDTEPSFLQGTGIGQYLLYLLAHLPASFRSICATTPVDWLLDRRVGSGRVRGECHFIVWS